MLKFRFAGHLRRHFSEIDLNVETPAQGLRLLMAQSMEFKKSFLTSKLKMKFSGEEISSDDFSWHMDRRLKDGAIVSFTPVIEGAIAGVAIGIALFSVAYSVYAYRNMRNKSSAKAAETNTITNNSFTSAENRVGQGRPVPLLLGEMVVGSNVISLGIDTTNNQDWEESIS